MSFLSGLLGSLGGPGNIIKSVGEFVSDSLSNLAQGKGLEGIAEAGSHAIKTLAGIPDEDLSIEEKKKYKKKYKRPIEENKLKNLSRKIKELRESGEEYDSETGLTIDEISDMRNRLVTKMAGGSKSNQITNNRPMVITTRQIPNSAIPGNSIADARPIISTINNQPRAKTIPIEKPLDTYIEQRGTNAGFPKTTMIKVNKKSEPIYVEPVGKRTRQQMKMKKNQNKKFKNYMK